MPSIKNIELLPQFFTDVKKQNATADLKNEKFVVALMSDYLPGAVELKRAVCLAYASNAMECILDIAGNMDDAVILRNKALERMVDYSFMDEQIAVEIINGIIVAIYPQLQPVFRTAHSAATGISQTKGEADNREKIKSVLTVLHIIFQYDVRVLSLINTLSGIDSFEEIKAGWTQLKTIWQDQSQIINGALILIYELFGGDSPEKLEAALTQMSEVSGEYFLGETVLEDKLQIARTELLQMYELLGGDSPKEIKLAFDLLATILIDILSDDEWKLIIIKELFHIYSLEKIKAALTQLATFFYDVLQKRVDVLLRIYKLFGIEPPVEYRIVLGNVPPNREE